MNTEHITALADWLEDHAKYGRRAPTTRHDRMHNSPTQKMHEAEEITGRKFKPRDYLGAATVLRWAATQVARGI